MISLSMNLLFGVPALAGPGRLKAGHHTDGTTQTGSWSQCTAQKSWGLSMNRTNSNSTRQSKAAEHRRSPKRKRYSNASKDNHVLECGSVLPLSARCKMYRRQSQRALSDWWLRENNERAALIFVPPRKVFPRCVGRPAARVS